MFACRALQLYTLPVCVTGYSNNYSLTRFRGPLSPHRFGKTPTKPPMPSALTGDSDRQAHTPSIAFRHLPPKEGCRNPVAWSVRQAQTPGTGLPHPPWRKVPESDARSVRQAQTPSTGLRHPSFKAALSTDERVFSRRHSGAVAGDRWSGLAGRTPQNFFTDQAGPLPPSTGVAGPAGRWGCRPTTSTAQRLRYSTLHGGK